MNLSRRFNAEFFHVQTRNVIQRLTVPVDDCVADLLLCRPTGIRMVDRHLSRYGVGPFNGGSDRIQIGNTVGDTYFLRTHFHSYL